MEKIIPKLNNILGQNEPLEVSKLPNLLAQIFLQLKEEEVKKRIPALSKMIDSFTPYLKSDKNRINIVFGFLCHLQILKVQVQIYGMDDFFKANHQKCIEFLLEKNKDIVDGRASNDNSDGRMTKDMIKALIEKNRSKASSPSPAPQASSSSSGAKPEYPPSPYPHGSFTVAIPK